MKSLLNHWNLDFGAILIFILFLSGYFYLAGGWKFKKGAGIYFTGLFLMLFIEFSPIHFLGMHYLLSAFMVVHIILLLICGPLILIGLPPESSSNRFIYCISSFFKNYPWIGWLTGIGLMWFWHIPVIFDAVFPTHHHQFSLHILMTLHSFSLLIAGILFAWPILGPVKEFRIHALVGVVYLFTACVGCSILGLLLAFAPPTLYKHYFLPDEFGLSSLIKAEWNISRAQDQLAAGLIMWVPCCFIYLSGVMLLVYRWLNQKEQVEIAHPFIIKTGGYE
jgi:putative membrane protein